MFKSEAASWFRIYEMFKFDAFHMYGIIGTAVILGVIIVAVIKRFNVKSFYGDPIEFAPGLSLDWVGPLQAPAPDPCLPLPVPGTCPY
jgi:hypothetical protein